jgi:hypothetical protein
VEFGEPAGWVDGSAPAAGPGLAASWAWAKDAPIRSAEARTIGDAVARAIVSKRMFPSPSEQIEPLGILISKGGHTSSEHASAILQHFAAFHHKMAWRDFLNRQGAALGKMIALPTTVFAGRHTYSDTARNITIHTMSGVIV